jgi:hypothetical protein
VRKRTLLFVLAIPCCAFLMLATAQATDYYVDFSSGNDGYDGLSPTPAASANRGPWQHCPGDTSYSGSIKLQDGDRVYFKRGVTYHGKIRTQADGVAYTVLEWGTGDAVFDGSKQDACFEVRHNNTMIDGGAAKNMMLTGSAVQHAAIWSYVDSGKLSGSTFTHLKIDKVGSSDSEEGIGIKIGGNANSYTDYTISYNDIIACYSAGIKISGAGTSRIHIHDNLLELNGFLPSERTQVNLSSNAGLGVQNVEFHNNTVRNAATASNGINCNNANNQIFDNQIYDNPGHGISLDPNYNTNYSGITSVFRNRISGNQGYGIIVGETNALRHAKIYNNIFMDNGPNSYEINFTSKSSNNELYFNTIYHNVTGHGIRIQTSCVDNIIKNNVIWILKGYAINDSTGKIIEDSNCIFRSDGFDHIVWKDQLYSTISAFRTDSGQGMNSKWNDPLLLDFVGFHIDKTSPCSATGVNIQGITDDLYKKARHTDTSMGAVETITLSPPSNMRVSPE